MQALGLALLLCASAASAATPAANRNLFLNGVDISSARSQDLKRVDVRISDNGDIFILAPHYQVNEEDTYVPLSKFVQGLNQPAHKAPQAIEPGRTRELPVDAPTGTQLLPKAGDTTPPPTALSQPAPRTAALPAPAKPAAPPQTPAMAPLAEPPKSDAAVDPAATLDPAVPPAAAGVLPAASAPADSAP